MADKIDVKLVLELRQSNMSQRAIATSRHISTKSIAAVWKRADTLGVSYADVADKSDDEVYLLFFPDKFRKETVYAPVNYEYVHSELKKTGVVCEVDWSGKTMCLNDPDDGNKVYPVYLFVAVLPYSQLAYVEPCLNMNEQTWSLASGQDVEYKESKKQENESSPAGFVRGAAYYGGDDHAE